MRGRGRRRLGGAIAPAPPTTRRPQERSRALMLRFDAAIPIAARPLSRTCGSTVAGVSTVGSPSCVRRAARRWASRGSSPTWGGALRHRHNREERCHGFWFESGSVGSRRSRIDTSSSLPRSSPALARHLRTRKQLSQQTNPNRGGVWNSKRQNKVLTF